MDDADQRESSGFNDDPAASSFWVEDSGRGRRRRRKEKNRQSSAWTPFASWDGDEDAEGEGETKGAREEEDDETYNSSNDTEDASYKSHRRKKTGKGIKREDKSPEGPPPHDIMEGSLLNDGEGAGGSRAVSREQDQENEGESPHRRNSGSGRESFFSGRGIMVTEKGGGGGGGRKRGGHFSGEVQGKRRYSVRFSSPEERSSSRSNRGGRKDEGEKGRGGGPDSREYRDGEEDDDNDYSGSDRADSSVHAPSPYYPADRPHEEEEEEGEGSLRRRKRGGRGRARGEGQMKDDSSAKAPFFMHSQPLSLSPTSAPVLEVLVYRAFFLPITPSGMYQVAMYLVVPSSLDRHALQKSDHSSALPDDLFFSQNGKGAAGGEGGRERALSHSPGSLALDGSVFGSSFSDCADQNDKSGGHRRISSIAVSRQHGTNSSGECVWQESFVFPLLRFLHRQKRLSRSLPLSRSLVTPLSLVVEVQDPHGDRETQQPPQSVGEGGGGYLLASSGGSSKPTGSSLVVATACIRLDDLILGQSEKLNVSLRSPCGSNTGGSLGLSLLVTKKKFPALAKQLQEQHGYGRDYFLQQDLMLLHSLLGPSNGGAPGGGGSFADSTSNGGTGGVEDGGTDDPRSDASSSPWMMFPPNSNGQAGSPAFFNDVGGSGRGGGGGSGGGVGGGGFPTVQQQQQQLPLPVMIQQPGQMGGGQGMAPAPVTSLSGEGVQHPATMALMALQNQVASRTQEVDQLAQQLQQTQSLLSASLQREGLLHSQLREAREYNSHLGKMLAEALSKQKKLQEELEASQRSSEEALASAKKEARAAQKEKKKEYHEALEERDNECQRLERIIHSQKMEIEKWKERSTEQKDLLADTRRRLFIQRKRCDRLRDDLVEAEEYTEVVKEQLSASQTSNREQQRQLLALAFYLRNGGRGTLLTGSEGLTVDGGIDRLGWEDVGESYEFLVGRGQEGRGGLGAEESIATVDKMWKYNKGGRSTFFPPRPRSEQYEEKGHRKKHASSSSSPVLALTDYAEGGGSFGNGSTRDLNQLHRKRTHAAALIKEATRETPNSRMESLRSQDRRFRRGVHTPYSTEEEEDEGSTDNGMDSDTKTPTELEPTPEEAWRLTPTGTTREEFASVFPSL